MEYRKTRAWKIYFINKSYHEAHVDYEEQSFKSFMTFMVETMNSPI